ncbi:hypothetical protein LCGC14_2893620, partial [marine sediment metagenome]
WAREAVYKPENKNGSKELVTLLEQALQLAKKL